MQLLGVIVEERGSLYIVTEYMAKVSSLGSSFLALSQEVLFSWSPKGRGARLFFWARAVA